MYAVEFTAKPNGRYLELPFNLPDNLVSELKVIIMSKENILGSDLVTDNTKDLFRSYPKGKKKQDFDRDDAYDTFF